MLLMDGVIGEELGEVRAMVLLTQTKEIVRSGGPNPPPNYLLDLKAK